MKVTFITKIICLFYVLALLNSCTTEMEEPSIKENDADIFITPKALVTSAAVTKMHIIVPAYFYTDAALWNQMNEHAALYPNMIYAIINRINGPGNAPDPVYLSRITAFRKAGGKILVYVNTYDYPAFKPVREFIVKSDVDKWFNWYGDEIDGVFHDQMYPASGGQERFYRNLYRYVKNKKTDAIVVGNPGGHTSPAYLTWNGHRLTDVICTFENAHADFNVAVSTLADGLPI
jgi:hypothetical protein